jgi:hypothetical protein
MTEREKVGVFLNYSDKQGGILPCSAAAVYLRITPQGVNSAINRQKLSAIRWKGKFYCGFKSLNNYRYFNASKFKDTAKGKCEYVIDLDDQGERITL